MKTRFSTDIIAWFVSVIAAVLIRTVSSDLPIRLVPTLLVCGIAGLVWISLRTALCRTSRSDDARWHSATLAVASTFGAGVVALLVILLFDIAAARSVVATALVLAGVGWGMSSERFFRIRDVRIA